jgi:hypothetical protein
MGEDLTRALAPALVSGLQVQRINMAKLVVWEPAALVEHMTQTRILKLRIRSTYSLTAILNSSSSL